MMLVATEKFIEKAKSIHGDRYDYSEVVYVNAKTKVGIICKIHGRFEQTPDKHINGKCGCPMCAGNKGNTISTFVKKAKIIHGLKYDYRLVDYLNNKTDVCIICPEHGEFWQTPTNHLSGKGCPFCANNVILTTDQFIEKAKSIHGDKYDYSHVVYRGNRVPVDIICQTHGVFSQRPYAHLSGSGCPLCGSLTSIEHHDFKAIHEKGKQTFLSHYGVSNPMKDPYIRRKHSEVMKSKEVNDKRIETKRANNSFNSSLSEYRLGLLLESLFGDDVHSNYVSDKYPFKCDYYISSRNLYIELNAHWSHGGHWYTEADKKLVEVWKGKSKFYQNAAITFSVRDVEKRRVARNNHLNYIVFWKSDLSDVQRWIDCGCPDGQDWDIEYSWLL